MAKFVVLRKGGGGKIAVNPELVTFVRSATGAFTDLFFDGQQIAVEGTFEEVVNLLSIADRRAPETSSPGVDDAEKGLTFHRLNR